MSKLSPLGRLQERDARRRPPGAGRRARRGRAARGSHRGRSRERAEPRMLGFTSSLTMHRSRLGPVRWRDWGVMGGGSGVAGANLVTAALRGATGHAGAAGRTPIARTKTPDDASLECRGVSTFAAVRPPCLPGATLTRDMTARAASARRAPGGAPGRRSRPARGQARSTAARGTRGARCAFGDGAQGRCRDRSNWRVAHVSLLA